MLRGRISWKSRRFAIADVQHGIWRPYEPELTFHEFASEWPYRLESEGLSENTLKD